MMIHDGTILLTHIHFATMINFFSYKPGKTKHNPSSSNCEQKRDKKPFYDSQGVPKRFGQKYSKTREKLGR